MVDGGHAVRSRSLASLFPGEGERVIQPRIGAENSGALLLMNTWKDNSAPDPSADTTKSWPLKSQRRARYAPLA